MHIAGAMNVKLVFSSFKQAGNIPVKLDSEVTVRVTAEVITDHPYNNVPENVFKKLGVNLHLRPDHPLGILKDAIYSYFDQQFPGVYQKFDDLYPVVSTKAVQAFPPSPTLSLQALLSLNRGKLYPMFFFMLEKPRLLP